jgi:hypothetical protein
MEHCDQPSSGGFRDWPTTIRDAQFRERRLNRPTLCHALPIRAVAARRRPRPRPAPSGAGYELAEDVRYNQRSSAERVNGNLKDNCGGNHVRVRGAPKVFCHLMFGILVVTVEQMMRLVT